MSVETPEFAAMVRRVIRAYGRRVVHGDEPDLAELVGLRDVIEESIAVAVHGQRAMYGRSWSEIAAGLGTTRQAAQQRYGRSAVPAAALSVVSPREEVADSA